MITRQERLFPLGWLEAHHQALGLQLQGLLFVAMTMALRSGGNGVLAIRALWGALVQAEDGEEVWFVHLLQVSNDRLGELPTYMATKIISKKRLEKVLKRACRTRGVPVFEGLLVKEHAVKEFVNKPVGVELVPVVVQDRQDVVIELGARKVMGDLSPQFRELLGGRAGDNVVTEIGHGQKDLARNRVLVVLFLGQLVPQLFERERPPILCWGQGEEFVKVHREGYPPALVELVQDHLPPQLSQRLRALLRLGKEAKDVKRRAFDREGGGSLADGDNVLQHPLLKQEGETIRARANVADGPEGCLH